MKLFMYPVPDKVSPTCILNLISLITVWKVLYTLRKNKLSMKYANIIHVSESAGQFIRVWGQRIVLHLIVYWYVTVVYVVRLGGTEKCLSTLKLLYFLI